MPARIAKGKPHSQVLTMEEQALLCFMKEFHINPTDTILFLYKELASKTGDQKERKALTQRFFDALGPLYDDLRFFLSIMTDLPEDKRRELIVESVDKYAASGCPTVLEVGAGTGHITSGILGITKRDPKCVSLDISSSMLNSTAAKLRSLSRYDRFFPIRADGEKVPIHTSSVDAVILSYVLEYSENPNLLLEDALRVLKPQGILLLLTAIYDHEGAQELSLPQTFSAEYIMQLLKNLKHTSNYEIEVKSNPSANTLLLVLRKLAVK